MGRLLHYWGYIALLLALLGWFAHLFVPTLILVFSLGALGYVLLQAPAWCGAITRDGLMCRNNSSGLLLGCHLREHKFQKLKMAFVPRRWKEMNRGLWTSPREALASLTGIAAIVSTVAALIVHK